MGRRSILLVFVPIFVLAAAAGPGSQAPPAEFMAMLEDTARSVDGVTGIHGLRAEYIGPGVIHADIHIEVSSTLTLVQAHDIAKRVDA
jgi:divalent metal cation (Fe/Co/Zn/Cd) transporter